ncbi:MAG TPA: hypothetical protein VFG49_04355 [Dyella sp.]|nr:hypothetical protein [Dyella sp.]HET6552749.1 hypothetical protein [Dyella sp.]
MSSLSARFAAMTIASAMAGERALTLNNNNANNNTRTNGWAGV